jgi:hypothetical protein
MTHPHKDSKPTSQARFQAAGEETTAGPTAAEETAVGPQRAPPMQQDAPPERRRRRRRCEHPTDTFFLPCLVCRRFFSLTGAPASTAGLTACRGQREHRLAALLKPPPPSVRRVPTDHPSIPSSVAGEPSHTPPANPPAAHT